MRHAAVALLFLIAAAICGTAGAQDGPKVGKSAIQASKEFEALLTKAAAAKAVPNLQTTPAAPLIARIFDVNSLRSLPPATAQDSPWLTDWLGAMTASYMAIINFGADPKSENYMQSVAANIERFEDEVALGSEALLRIFARLSNAITAYFNSLPEAERNNPARQKGLMGVRGGYIKSFTGGIQFAADDIKPANARRTTLAMRDTAQDFASVLNAEQRAELADLATRAAAETKDPETRDNFTAVAQTLKGAK